MTTNFVKIFSIFSIFGILHLLLIFNHFVALKIPFEESNEGKARKGEWVEYEPKWKENKKVVDAKQQLVIYDEEDGSCAILKNGEYVNVVVEGDKLNFKCLDEFLDYAMKPACGNPNYEMMKACYQQYIYEGKSFGESRLANGDVYEQMRAFAFLDGCFVCNSANTNTDGIDGTNGVGNIELKVKMKITYLFPAGGFFNNCPEQTAIATPETIVKFNSNAGMGTFTLPLIFFVRKCDNDNIFFWDSPPSKYEKIKMEVEHNCIGDGTKTDSFTVDLPDFNPKEHEENFAEMRFLQFNLSKGINGISVWKKIKETGKASVNQIEGKLDWKINEKNENTNIRNPNNGVGNGGERPNPIPYGEG